MDIKNFKPSPFSKSQPLPKDGSSRKRSYSYGSSAEGPQKCGNPSITVPVQGKQVGNKSKIHVRGNKKSLGRPLTPLIAQKNSSTSQIDILTGQCMATCDFRKYICSDTPLEVKKTIEVDISKKATALESLKNLLSKEDIVQSLTSEQLFSVFSMISSNILREIYDPTLLTLYREEIPQINQYLHNHIYLSHQILLKLASHTFLDLTSNINDGFLYKLIAMLKSTDINERSTVIETVKFLFTTLSHTRNKVFSYLFSLVEDYLSGYVLFFCISPILEFFRWFFSSLKSPLNESHGHIFMKLYGLISSIYSMEFGTSLIVFAASYRALCPSITEWCISFLFEHWPITNIDKTILYIREISSIVKNTDSKQVEKILELLTPKIIECLTSDCFKSITSAIELCLDSTFLSSIDSLQMKYLKRTFPLVVEAQKHWSHDVRTAAQKCIHYVHENNKDFINELYKQSQSSPPNNSPVIEISNSNNFWSLVIGAAKFVDPLIVINPKYQAFPIY